MKAVDLLILWGVLALLGCREVAEPSVVDEPWRALSGTWEPLMGGEFSEEDGVLRLGMIEALTAAKWLGDPPAVPFELEAEARRVMGTDFFLGLTFPAGAENQPVSLIVGGWGGDVVGISSVDGLDASENSTTVRQEFEKLRWYRVRVESLADRLRVWIDGDLRVDLAVTGRQLGMRAGPIEECAPLGLATWETTGEIRSMRWRPIPAAQD